MVQFVPVILCGGTGTRLWPMSREGYPKQFSKLVHSNETMLQSTCLRFAKMKAQPPILITRHDYRFIVGEQMNEIGIEDRTLLVEPEGRNTAPAICAAALCAMQKNEDAVLFVAPADHYIQDQEAFEQAALRALSVAKEGEIVTFGVLPNRPETGYGYIEIKELGQNIASFVRFVEKPDESSARKMIKTGRYLWNSGMFVFQAKTILDAFKKYAPHILEPVRYALEDGHKDLDFYRIGDKFAQVDQISIDYAILEKCHGRVVTLDCAWNDLGSWESIWQESAKDTKGVVQSGQITTIDCRNTLLRAEDETTHLVGIGLDNIIAVAMRDAVLVADKSRAQDVAQAVNIMRQAKILQADHFQRSYRPWGWFETLVKGARFHVKTLLINPGASLSLQSHLHRAEHWVIVEGTARITINGTEQTISENQSTYIPLGSKHRIQNMGKVDLRIIEVQTGTYLEEDDIVRYEDIYARK